MYVMMQIAGFLARLLSLYSFLIWVRIIMSWFVPYPREGSLTWYFSRIIDPYLNLFRSRRFQVGYFDFSPLLAIGLLSVAQSLLSVYSVFGVMTLSLAVQMLISAFWSYAMAPLLMILIIMLVMRTIGAFTHSPGLSRMGMVTENLIRRVQELFFPHRIVRETTLCIIADAIAVLAYFAFRYLASLLIVLAGRIPF